MTYNVQPRKFRILLAAHNLSSCSCAVLRIPHLYLPTLQLYGTDSSRYLALLSPVATYANSLPKMDELQGLIEHLFSSIAQLSELLFERTSRNLTASFKSMTAQQYIRLVAIIGAYCLLRPYVLKMIGKEQAKQMEEQEKKQAEITPNQLRGQKIEIPEDSDDEEGEEQTQTTAADWGKKARKRQRHMIKKLLDAEEKRLEQLQEDEEDKEIEQYLVG